MNKRRIFIATGVYPPESGGPATYTKLLEERLPARGFEVSVLPFRTVRHLPKGVRHVAYFFMCLGYAASADIVYAQDTLSVGLPASLAAMVAGKAFLVRVPGDYAWEQARQRFGVTDEIDEFQTKRYSRSVERMRTLQRFVVRRASFVIVPSNYFKGIVSTWGVASERLRVIYNGVEPAKPRQPVVLPSRPFMVSVGRLVPWKGFGGLIRLLERLPQWHLVIVGGGPERAGLETLAAHEGVAERLIFTGELPRAQAVGWCFAADAFVLNTSFESFSFQIVEAMQAGVPVIATHIGSIPELVTSGKEGVLLSPDDTVGFKNALETISSDARGWQQKIAAARLKVEQFSIDRTLDALCELLKTI